MTKYPSYKFRKEKKVRLARPLNAEQPPARWDIEFKCGEVVRNVDPNSVESVMVCTAHGKPERYTLIMQPNAIEVEE